MTLHEVSCLRRESFRLLDESLTRSGRKLLAQLRCLDDALLLLCPSEFDTADVTLLLDAMRGPHLKAQSAVRERHRQAALYSAAPVSGGADR